MQSFKITQKILAIGDTYEVRQSDSDEICYLVKGKVFSLKPILEMRQGMDGSVTHILKGNLWKTEFTVVDSSEMEIGSIKYPLIAFFQRFTLVTEGKVLNAKGGVTAWKFICTKSTKILHSETDSRSRPTNRYGKRWRSSPRYRWTRDFFKISRNQASLLALASFGWGRGSAISHLFVFSFRKIRLKSM
jgi:hypothetical protein